MRIKRRQPQGANEQVPIKRFKVAKVENNPVAFGDGAVVECFGADNRKQFLAAITRVT